MFMYQITRPIIKKQTIKPALWEITVGLEKTDLWATQIAPGQFFLVQCAIPFTTYLRRAIFPAGITSSPLEETAEAPSGLQFLFSAVDLADPGLAWLMSRKVGQTIDLLGPFGQGFPAPQQASSLLLIGSSPTIGPLGPLLFLLRQAIQRGADVVLALEATRAADLYPFQTLPPAAELRIATLDGSLGYRGSILDHLEDLTRWADTICAVGVRSFYRRLKAHLDQTHLQLMTNFANVLITDLPIHICGTGICTLCTLPTTKGLKLACQDGPIFDLSILPLEEYRSLEGPA